ncbi:hypothetical protein [Primorskyibacter sp. S187A]|uniref:hypothetical protein n=1 Tax=Primorskyibacter sp. S187A TaxID=3415130 RepID=UPI003C7A5244
MKAVWIVASALAACGAVFGLLLSRAEPLDEGKVIAFYAAQYVAETGGDLTDCRGLPGRRADVWLIVLCEGAAGRFSYRIGHDGQLEQPTGEEA